MRLGRYLLKTNIPLAVSLGLLVPLCASALTFDFSGSTLSGGTFVGTTLNGSNQVVGTTRSMYTAWLKGDTAITALSTDVQNQVVISDGAGGAFVAWDDKRAAIGNNLLRNDDDIYVQHLDSNGNPTWDFDGVPAVTDTNTQSHEQLISDGAGGIIVAWTDQRSGNQIYAQRFNSSGVAQWAANGVLVSANGSFDSSVDGHNAEMLADGAGGAFISFEASNDVKAQHINSSGVAQWESEASLTNGSTGNRAQLVSDGTGGFIATWQTTASGIIMAQRVNSSGVAQWTAGGVTISTGGSNRENPNIVSDASNGAIIVWDTTTFNNSDIYAQRINGAGVVQWTANGVGVATSSNNQRAQKVLADGSGGAFVAWEDNRAGNIDVYMQRIASTSAMQWTINGVVVSSAANSQEYVSLAPDSSGGVIAVWQDGRNGNSNRDVYTQHFDQNGNAQLTVNGVPVVDLAGDQDVPTPVTDGAGGAIVVWVDQRNNPGNTVTYDLYAQRISSSPAEVTAYPDAFYYNYATSSSAVDWSTFTLSSTATLGANDYIDFSTRLLNSDEFDDGDTSNVANLNWGGDSADLAESDGLLTLSNLAGGQSYADYEWDSGEAAKYYPASTTVRARVKLNVASGHIDMFSDDFGGNDVYVASTGDWQTIQFTDYNPLSKVGFEISTADPSFGPSDSFQIDWVQIEPPLAFNDWTPLSGSAIQSGTGYALQYRATLGSSDHLSTPALSGVTIDQTSGGGGGGGGGVPHGGGEAIITGYTEHGGPSSVSSSAPSLTSAPTPDLTALAVTPTLGDPLASTTQPLFPRTLSQGSRGWDVLLLQNVLKFLDTFPYSALTDYFGSLTKGAVVLFQKQQSIDPIGIAGPATRAALEQAYYDKAAQGCSFPVEIYANGMLSTSTIETTFKTPGGFARVTLKNGMLQSAYGDIGLPGDGSQTTLERLSAFIDSQKSLFGIESLADLKVVSTTDDGSGTLIRYERLVHGLPVYGSTLVVEVSSSTIISVLATLPHDAEIKNALTLSADEASAKAAAGLAAASSPAELVAYDGALVGNCQTHIRIAYKVDLENPQTGEPMTRIIDAATGVTLFDSATSQLQATIAKASTIIGGAPNGMAGEMLSRAQSQGFIAQLPALEQLRVDLKQAAYTAAKSGVVPGASTQSVSYRDCGRILNSFAAAGVGEKDTDNDCVEDSIDICPLSFNPTQGDVCSKAYFESVKNNAPGCTMNPLPPTTLSTTTVEHALSTDNGFVRSEVAGNVLKSAFGEMKLPGTDSQSLGERVDLFFDQNAVLFGIHSHADVELASQDGTSLRYERLVQGLPVYGSDVHITIASSTVSSITATLPQSSDVLNEQTLSKNSAIAAALAGTSATDGQAEPIIYNANLTVGCQSGNRLAYKVTLSGGTLTDPSVRIVDAQTGTVLLDEAGMHGAQQFNAWSITSPGNVRTLVKSDTTSNTLYNLSSIVKSPSLAQESAQDIYKLASATYQWFLGAFGSDSYDEKGGGLDLVYWPDPSFQDRGAVFTNGSLSGNVAFQGLKNLRIVFFNINSIDQQTMTHEFGHAVLYSSGILAKNPPRSTVDPSIPCYNCSTEDVAISEALPDFFAYLHTGDTTLAGRDMSAHESRNGYTGDEYEDSLIISHALYLADAGGSDNGIDVTKAQKGAVGQILYDAVRNYLPKLPNFDTLRSALHQAAWNAAKNEVPLNGVTVSYRDCGSVLNGFAAVGIGEKDQDYDCFPDSKDNCPETYNPEQDDVCSDEAKFKQTYQDKDWQTTDEQCFFIAINSLLKYPCGTAVDLSPAAQALCINNPGAPNCITSGRVRVIDNFSTRYFYDDKLFTHTEVFTDAKKQEITNCAGKYCEPLKGAPWTYEQNTVSTSRY